MKQIGISVYPDFYNQEEMKEQLDFAKSLGYQVVFTSIQLGDLGFKNTSIGISEGFIFLFEYCHKIGLEIHVDLNDRMLAYIGASPDNLKPLDDLKIRVLRLDGGFSHREVAVMTNNPYGIIIEENASMLQFPLKRIETIVQEGNVNQYYACHNYFPLKETGLSYDDALSSAKLFKSYGARVGIFISSLYADNQLNNVGNGIPTIESHRYKPAHVQAMELFVHPEYDYVLFGDTNPSKQELQRVSEVAINDTLASLRNRYDIDVSMEEELDGLYCIELPVWFDAFVDPIIKKKLTSIVFLARADQPEMMVRATQSRDICATDIYNPIIRTAYSLVLDNNLSNRYSGEIQIPLQDLPAVRYANVIGQVKPCAKKLVELLKYGQVCFVLKEE